MNTLNTSTVIPVDTLWHANWGFCVRTLIGGQSTDFYLDSRIQGSHRAYAERFIAGPRREHDSNADKTGTPNRLITGVVAHIHARIIATQDDIPLDPGEAISTIQKLWNARIERANPKDLPELVSSRDRLCAQVQRVLSGDVPSVMTIGGLRGVCVLGESS